MSYISESVVKDAIRVAQTAHEQYLSALIWERVAAKEGDYDAVESARIEKAEKKAFMDGAYTALDALGLEWEPSEVAGMLEAKLAEFSK